MAIIIDCTIINKRTQNILMLVAHPDDETLFGFYDLINSNCKVICFTNKDNKVRSRDFANVMNTTKQTSIMFDYKDSLTDKWESISNDNFIEIILPHLDKKYDMIVSHNSDGELGHIQHKRVHSIAVSLSNKLEIPYASFLDRFDASFHNDNNTLLHNILCLYTSEQKSRRKFCDFLYNKSEHIKKSTEYTEKVIDDATKGRNLNVLMLVAHPDDETLFGFYDLINSNCTVICFTNKGNEIRSRDFANVMNTTKQTSIMFDYKDSLTDKWESISNDNFIEIILPHLDKKYDIIVSHNSDG